MFVALREPEITEGMGETMMAFEAPCTDGDSRDMADDATVFAAPVDGSAGRGAGETGEAPGTRVLAGSKTADAFEAPEKSAGGEAGGTGEA